MTTTRRIVITGATGLIGGALAERLRAAGDQVQVVTRTPKAPGDIGWDPASGRLDGAALEGASAVVNLAGASVAERWTDAHKKRIVDSRVKGTRLLATTLSELASPPKVLVSASATGFYGDRGDTKLTEADARGSGFLADVCVEWEAAAAPALERGLRVVHPRFGIVLSDKGGALKKMALPFKMGVGGRIGSGDQYMSWIHLEDVARALQFAIDTELSGPINLTAPEPATNAEFTRAMGKALHRPTALPLPGFAAKLGLGSEMAQEMLLTGQRALPAALQAAGFRFAWPKLDAALANLLG